VPAPLSHGSPAECLWHWTLWAICLLVLGFLILPILIIVPLSFSSGTFLSFPLPGLSLR
jgi:putative spermidine/putrescine transport system permease protein